MPYNDILAKLKDAIRFVSDNKSTGTVLNDFSEKESARTVPVVSPSSLLTSVLPTVKKPIDIYPYIIYNSISALTQCSMVYQTQ